VVGLAVAVACGRLGFDDGAIDGPRSDGTLAPDGLPACAPGANAYGFEGSSGCPPWGVGSGGATTIISTGGRLVITPTPGIAAGGQCLATQPIAFAAGSGGWVEVDAVLDPAVPTAYTRFDLDDVVAQVRLRLVATGGELRASAGPFSGMTELGQVPYTPAMRWWRWRAIGADSIAEFSPDGRTWTQLATSQGVPGQVHAVLSAGHGSAQPPAGSAMFAGFNECPP
jgi:hypothetical protein